MSVLRLIPVKGEAIVVDADEAIVGREANCNVVVSHPSVSRRHALLKRKQDVFFVVDQESANGTFVDSKHVVDAALKDGTVLRFGSATFRVEVRDDVPEESVAEDDLVISPNHRAADIFGDRARRRGPVRECLHSSLRPGLELAAGRGTSTYGAESGLEAASVAGTAPSVFPDRLEAALDPGAAAGPLGARPRTGLLVAAGRRRDGSSPGGGGYRSGGRVPGPTHGLALI